MICGAYSLSLSLIPENVITLGTGADFDINTGGAGGDGGNVPGAGINDDIAVGDGGTNGVASTLGSLLGRSAVIFTFLGDVGDPGGGVGVASAVACVVASVAATSDFDVAIF